MRWPWRKKRTPTVVRDTDGLPESIRIIPSEEATDLGTWGLMRALETGETVHAYVDDNGDWINATTGEVIRRGAG